jgi:hypothetical protein
MATLSIGTSELERTEFQVSGNRAVRSSDASSSLAKPDGSSSDVSNCGAGPPFIHQLNFTTTLAKAVGTGGLLAVIKV